MAQWEWSEALLAEALIDDAMYEVEEHLWGTPKSGAPPRMGGVGRGPRRGPQRRGPPGGRPARGCADSGEAAPRGARSQEGGGGRPRRPRGRGRRSSQPRGSARLKPRRRSRQRMGLPPETLNQRAPVPLQGAVPAAQGTAGNGHRAQKTAGRERSPAGFSAGRGRSRSPGCDDRGRGAGVDTPMISEPGPVRGRHDRQRGHAARPFAIRGTEESRGRSD